ncbi:MAG TPA: hypothetical protein PLG30_14135 [Bacteroidia bacterium]|nr:hypothetical protein [Bacteroidia bacterium]
MSARFDAKKYLGTFWVKNGNFYFRKAGKKNVLQVTVDGYYRMKQTCNLKTMSGKKGPYSLVYKK